MKTAPRLFILAAAGLALAACSSLKTQPIPDITFAHEPPIGLNVRTLEVTSVYNSPRSAPNVEYKFQTPPEVVLKRWANERLRALGNSNRARFTVVNAAVTEQPLPKATGFLGTFQTEPGAKYTMTVEATLEVLDETDSRRSLASARVTRSRDLAEGVTAEERQLFWHELTKTVMDSFDKEMERSTLQYLGEWVK
jgi:hypothetical protein